MEQIGELPNAALPIFSVKGDGNCLFRCMMIGFHIFGSDEEHGQVRIAIADEIATHWEDYKSFSIHETDAKAYCGQFQGHAPRACRCFAHSSAPYYLSSICFSQTFRCVTGRGKGALQPTLASGDAALEGTREALRVCGFK